MEVTLGVGSMVAHMLQESELQKRGMKAIRFFGREGTPLRLSEVSVFVVRPPPVDARRL